MTPEQLHHWATFTGGSPLYGHLARLIATDAELLAVLNRIEHTPQPNVLLAGVHYLLASGRDGELALFYESLTDSPQPVALVDEPFRRFVLANQEELVEIGRTRYTQTNESRRCSVLLAGIMAAPFSQFHLIDVGTSAGLNLALDRYHYDFGGLTWGADSEVRLVCELRGSSPELRPIEILSRVGLDLNPLSPGDPDDRRWLRALVWPEQHERRERLDGAIRVLATVDIRMIEGDALDTLPGLLGSIPHGEPAVVLNSFVLNQLGEPGRERYSAILAEARAVRPVHQVSLEALVRDESWAHLYVDSGDGGREIARAHHHGEWLELYAWP